MSKEKTKKVLPASVVVLLLGIVAVGWFWMTPGVSGASANSTTPAQVFYDMDSLVVNVSKTGNNNRYLKVKPVLVVRQSEYLDAIKRQSPIIRSRLIALYSQETVSSLLADDGFDALREKSLDVVKDVIGGEGDVVMVSEVLFNEYVIQ